jgi:serine/threonine-protein kinase
MPTATATPVAIDSPTPAISSTWERPADGMVMVYVPEGEFTMGGNDGSSNEQPVHTVYLDAYWIDQTEVTNGIYSVCVQAGACQPPRNTSSTTQTSYYGNSQYADYPVIYVAWNDAQAYCAWADARLPTEAEWEKAARGTDARTYPWGNTTPNTNLLNFNRNVDDTTAVGNYPSGASPYGALVADWTSETYYGSSPSSNPTGPTSGDLHVLRGGSWHDPEYFVRSAYRGGDPPDYYNIIIGFRCVLASP